MTPSAQFPVSPDRPEAFHLDEVNARLRERFAPAKPPPIQTTEPTDFHSMG